ncbi:murein hydrolase activator EnvC family protein [Rhizosaccharibacter radicis]|uniref:M23 family metallopeptidase n=1 Tax=Rhizosaccharibacter radicis TaxID=2782605 RepID=A0ABT1W2X5_9PROT|nr:M23 family metallopeptidase [Acetobacteraceae bacterium KSS12]
MMAAAMTAMALPGWLLGGAPVMASAASGGSAASGVVTGGPAPAVPAVPPGLDRRLFAQNPATKARHGFPAVADMRDGPPLPDPAPGGSDESASAAGAGSMTDGGGHAPIGARLHWPSPVAARCLSSPYGWRHRVGPMAPAGFHNGVDIPAPAGEMVRAPAAGRVSRIRRIGIGGLQVTVEHPGGLRTLYAHLGSVVPNLAEGRTMLAAGDPVGRIGRTGVTYGTHLFFAVWANGTQIDPEWLLQLPPC